jgi:hypothetical protein
VAVLVVRAWVVQLVAVACSRKLQLALWDTTNAVGAVTAERWQPPLREVLMVALLQLPWLLQKRLAQWRLAPKQLLEAN